MEKVTKKQRFRERCGECFYNGNCILKLNECFFIKNSKKPS